MGFNKKLFAAIAAPILSAAAATGLYFGAARLICNTAFERKSVLPAGGEGNLLHTHEMTLQGREWLHANDKTICCRKSSDGLMLVAHYFPADHAAATILAFHGWRGSWDIDFAAIAPVLHDKGYNLLLVEQRGQGHSDGDAMTFGLKERLDVPEWVQWYHDNVDAEIPLFLYGISMGAATVLMASAVTYPEQVKGIISDCAYTNAYDIIQRVAEAYFHIPEHPFCDSINRYCRRKLGTNLKEYSALVALHSATLPVLFIHGRGDHLIPADMTRTAYEVCSTDKELWLADGAGHAESYLMHPGEYMEKLEAFVERSLNGGQTL